MTTQAWLERVARHGRNMLVAFGMPRENADAMTAHEVMETLAHMELLHSIRSAS